MQKLFIMNLHKKNKNYRFLKPITTEEVKNMPNEEMLPVRFFFTGLTNERI